jgi:hypothetical protein
MEHLGKTILQRYVSLSIFTQILFGSGLGIRVPMAISVLMCALSSRLALRLFVWASEYRWLSVLRRVLFHQGLLSVSFVCMFLFPFFSSLIWL